ncbi:CRTAC1 family protein [Myxococcota bacterium]|nr:CRTAC1 family protein [Myxococcota bacterium]
MRLLRRLLTATSCLVLGGFAPGEVRAEASFVEAAAELGLGEVTNPNDSGTSQHGGGVAMLDFDLDDWPDLYVARKQPPNLLYRNVGGTFEEVTEIGDGAAYGQPWVGVASADVDGDGWPDLLLMGASGNRLLLNSGGDGTFEEAQHTGIEEEGRATVGAAFADLDRDGDLDAYVAGHARCVEPFLEEPPTFDSYSSDTCPTPEDVCLGNFLYIQVAPLVFEEKGRELGVDNDGCTLAVVASDFDGDGWIDLYSGNDHGARVEPDGLFWNEGVTDGGELREFSLDPNRLVLFNMGVAVGDPDRDGDLDYYFSNTYANKLWMGVAPRVYVESQDVAGVAGTLSPKVSWGTAFEDLDLDGWPDLFVANTNPYDIVFWNQGDGTFAEEWHGPKPTDQAAEFGAVFGDVDGDGDVDVVTGGMTHLESDAGDGSVQVYRNTLVAGPHWLKVRLRATTGHPDAIGARIHLRAGDDVQVQEVFGGGSFASAPYRVKHFGLGAAAVVDELTVSWPSGSVEVATAVAVDQLLDLVEGEPPLEPADGTPAIGDDDSAPADDDAGASQGGDGYEVGLDTPDPVGCRTGAGGAVGSPALAVLGALAGRRRAARHPRHP